MRILISESDPAIRATLTASVSALRGVSILGAVSSLTETYHLAEHRPPNVALVGESLVRKPEFEVLMLLFEAVKTRIVVVAKGSAGGGRLPALVQKAGLAVIDAQADGAALQAALRGTPLATAAVARPPSHAARAQAFRPERFIVIGSSTGGVDALIKVLARFPANCPPTLIVQHTGAAFSAGLTRLLNQKTEARVIEAVDGIAITPGMVAIAPGDERHLTIQRAAAGQVFCRLVDGPEICGHRPSVDRLFFSAVPFAAKAAAAILTGMGRDGAEGLLALRDAGARTFGQDAKTSLVYGMPKVAADLGAVERQVPIEGMGAALLAASAEKVSA